MKAFVITTSNKSEETFVGTLLNKLGIASHEMSAEELEDYSMLQSMKESDRNKKASRSSIMKKLES